MSQPIQGKYKTFMKEKMYTLRNEEIYHVHRQED